MAAEREEQLQALAWAQDWLLKSYRHATSAIPACPAHGEDCISHIFEWITEAAERESRLIAEVARLKERHRIDELRLEQVMSHAKEEQTAKEQEIAAIIKRELLRIFEGIYGRST